MIVQHRSVTGRSDRMASRASRRQDHEGARGNQDDGEYHVDDPGRSGLRSTRESDAPASSQPRWVRITKKGAPLAEAAAGAGFSDQSHLSRQFRRAYGATPGQWAAAQGYPGLSLRCGSDYLEG